MKNTKQKKHSTKGATKDLIEILKKDYKNKFQANFTTNNKGFQKIEIIDKKTKKIIQTLNDVKLNSDMKNYDDISAALILSLNI